MSQHRVVSLIASATEIVAALGFEDLLVGRSHECDFPPTVERLPLCSEAKIDVNGTSREIDDRVKSVLTDAVSVYRVFGDLLEELRPTVVITQTQCEVCAVSLKDVEEAVADRLGPDTNLVALEPMELADIWDDIHKVARALEAPERGETLVATLKSRLANIASKTSQLKNRPRIACIEWIDPLMTAGNWVPELVEIAGGQNVFGVAGQHSDWTNWNDLSSSDPDVIAVMPCGFDLPRTRREMAPLLEQSGWESLNAVRANRVFVCDGNQYFNRSGPRLVESAEILAEMLHPRLFDFGHQGSSWQRL